MRQESERFSKSRGHTVHALWPGQGLTPTIMKREEREKAMLHLYLRAVLWLAFKE
jgi:hypothetical protein